MLAGTNWVMVYVAPRGVGRTAWNADEKSHTQIRRRFMLLGQTLDGMRVWDVRRAIQAVRQLNSSLFADTPLWLQSQRVMGGVALYASLFEPDIKRLDLYELPASHRQGPIFLNVLRYLDLPQAVALAAERSQVVLYEAPSERWSYPRDVVANLGWNKKQLQIRKLPAP
jgi:hypothetical protein